MEIVIGTRGSLLAIRQTEWVRERLLRENPGILFNIKKISTKGDRILNAPLSKIGGKGLFTKELEEKLLDGVIDIAVHSMKDIPTELPDGLKIVAVTQREDAHDVLISKDDFDITHLPQCIRIGTSSLRRKAQLLRLYKNLEVVNLRGNLDTRLRKLNNNEIDGIIVAKAGIKRLYPDGLSQFHSNEIPFDLMLPAAGQGAFGIEIRKDDEKIERIVKKIDDAVSHFEVMAERTFLRRLGGGCQVPIAAIAEMRDNVIMLEGAVLSLDGGRIVKEKISRETSPELLGIELAEILLSRGAEEILKGLY